MSMVKSRELAHKLADQAMQSGIIKPLDKHVIDCEICGKARANNYIHPTYDQPLIVWATCGRCKDVLAEVERDFDKHPESFDYFEDIDTMSNEVQCVSCHKSYMTVHMYNHSDNQCNFCFSKMMRNVKRKVTRQSFYNSKYRSSDEGRMSVQAYLQSEKGKVTQRNAQIKYRSSVQGKEVQYNAQIKYRDSDKSKSLRKNSQSKYRKTIKGNDSILKYRQSEKGKEAQRRSNEIYKYKKMFAPDSKWRLRK